MMKKKYDQSLKCTENWTNNIDWKLNVLFSLIMFDHIRAHKNLAIVNSFGFVGVDYR